MLNPLSASAKVLEADLAAGDWYIVPTVRADAILSPLVIGRDDHDEPQSSRPWSYAVFRFQAEKDSARRHDQPLGFSASSTR
jgi:hypothetical protein